MSTHFYGFNVLAVCVAAAVSGSKKAVSAAAAAVVGIGLLTAPIDSAQANHGQSSIPVVIDFSVVSNAASDYELTRGYLVDPPLLGNLSVSDLEWAFGSIVAVASSGVYTENGGGGSGWFLFVPHDLDNQPIYDGRWIEVSFHISVSRNSRASLSVVVEDSEGNVYTPYNVSISYYGWRGW